MTDSSHMETEAPFEPAVVAPRPSVDGPQNDDSPTHRDTTYAEESVENAIEPPPLHYAAAAEDDDAEAPPPSNDVVVDNNAVQSDPDRITDEGAAHNPSGHGAHEPTAGAPSRTVVVDDDVADATTGGSAETDLPRVHRPAGNDGGGDGAFVLLDVVSTNSGING